MKEIENISKLETSSCQHYHNNLCRMWGMNTSMKLQLVRHSTIILHLNNKKILVDPILSPKGSVNAVKNVPNVNNNPLVDLPIPITSIVNCDAVLVTHMHRDHFDEKAAELLPKDIPIFCQPEDDDKIKSYGFLEVTPIKDTFEWKGINLTRTKGLHGHGIIAKRMAPVSGFIIAAPNEPKVYLMGDTVWCPYTEKAIEKHKPELVISFCGEAKISLGKAITMNADDILSICKKYPTVKVVAVHMEAWNHCRLTRKELSDFIINQNIEKQVYVPLDGEVLSFN